MNRRLSPLLCLGLGLLVTLGQIALAIGFAHPEGSLDDRYLALVQHDSYWFANIIERGYGTTLPPIDRKEMEVSNVAFFPAYPLLAAAVKSIFHLDTYRSLLLVAQAAAWGFWTYFFLFCRRWKVPVSLQVFGALAIAAHPAAFYLVAGYSESLFLMTLAGFLYWSTARGRGAILLATLHGFTMSATRIVGLPCALFPLANALLCKKDSPDGNWRRRIAAYTMPLLISTVSLLGGFAFFGYCQIRWGRWDLYLLTQEAGWAIEADYLAIFRPGNYHFAIPSLYDSLGASQLTSALAAVLFLAIGLAEVTIALQRESRWRQRIGFYVAAAMIYYLSLAGVASVHLESMLRYDLCVHALIVMGLLHFLREFRPPPVYVQALALGGAALICVAGLGLQGFYVWNFTQGNWIA